MSKKSIMGGVAAMLLSLGMLAFGVTTAQAATGQLDGCTVASNVPFKSGTHIAGSGWASCSTTANRTLYLEVHRSEGWWHPIIATSSDSDAKKSYSVSGQGCDDGKIHNYFTEVGFGGSELNSGNSGSMAGSC